jgi:hypothetical protein
MTRGTAVQGDSVSGDNQQHKLRRAKDDDKYHQVAALRGPKLPNDSILRLGLTRSMGVEWPYT